MFDKLCPLQKRACILSENSKKQTVTMKVTVIPSHAYQSVTHYFITILSNSEVVGTSIALTGAAELSAFTRSIKSHFKSINCSELASLAKSS